MAFQLGDDDTQGMNEMNLIPLIDVMLVLMIIFLLTATVLNQRTESAAPVLRSMSRQSIPFKSVSTKMQACFGMIRRLVWKSLSRAYSSKE